MRIGAVTLVATASLAGCGVTAHEDAAATTTTVSHQTPTPKGCRPRDLHDLLDRGTRAVSVYRVVDGEIGTLCHGHPSKTLVRSWHVLDVIASTADRHQLDYFVGYTAASQNYDTLAFVSPTFATGPEKTMAISLDAALDDPDQLSLTRAHELAHLVADQPGQFDEGAPRRTCPGYGTTEGCFPTGSYQARWVAQFWSAAELARLKPGAEPTIRSGEARCRQVPGFVDGYAASDPEEDLAESFSAFVFDVPVAAAVRPRLAFFAAIPALRAYRDRARAAGLTPLPDSYGGCSD